LDGESLQPWRFRPKDHFDSFGKARFQRLGLAFAAKQMMPQQMAKLPGE
jgi:hypothetical protein